MKILKQFFRKHFTLSKMIAILGGALVGFAIANLVGVVFGVIFGLFFEHLLCKSSTKISHSQNS
ncbi:MAG: hypothetical protein JXA16_13775 [Bacteroidales bacterium]|nr:hypothetical protein [Bacteroidales bacterium]